MKHPAAFSLSHAIRPYALFAALAFVPALSLRAADEPPAIAIPPRLSLSADGGVLATFDTASPTRATLRWGFAPDAMTNAVSDPGGTHAHVLAFPPLPPDATIYYSATASDGYSFANSFTAPPARVPDASFRFALHGDLEGGLEDNPQHIPYSRDVSRGIVAFAPSAVIATGDLADEAYGGFPSFPYYLAWTNFIQICSNEFSSIPFLPAMGNHDGRDPQTVGGEYSGVAYEGVPVLPYLAGKIDFIFDWLFGFKNPELVAFPITSLGAVGAALGLLPKFIAEGIVNNNAIAVCTAIGMCWSGFLSTHTAMLDSLGHRELIPKAIGAHTIGGLVAGVSAHWIYVLLALIF